MKQLTLFPEQNEPPVDEWTDDGQPEDWAVSGVRLENQPRIADEPSLSPSTKWAPFVAFDLEIARPFESGRPFGISCAATLTSYGDLVLWHGGDDSIPAPATHPDQMLPDQVHELAGYLIEQQSLGFTVIGWNSLAFDMLTLAEECRNPLWEADIAKLAMDHIDPYFQMLCALGYGIALETAGKGLGVGQKTEGMHGDLAPFLWSGDLSMATDIQKEQMDTLGVEPGSREAQDLCLVYVQGDVELTANIYRAIVEGKRLPWIARSGRLNTWYPTIKDSRLLTVNESLEIPEPDTSWMSKPRLRSDLLEWTKELLPEVHYD